MQVDGVVIPRGIATLAETLHRQCGTGLEIECTADISDDCNNALYNIENGNLVFVSLAARNQCVAVLAYSNLCTRQSELAANEVFQVAYQLWCDEIGHDDCACGRFLVLCHNEINILQAAATLINVGEKSDFDYLRVVQLGLPFLSDISVTDIVAISEAQYSKTINDMVAGMLFNGLEDVLVKFSHRAWELYAFSKNNPTDVTACLYLAALSSLMRNGQVDQVLDVLFADIKNDQPLFTMRALYLVADALVRHDLSTSLAQVCLLVLRQHSQHKDLEIQKSAVQAIRRAAERHHDLLVDLLGLAQENAHPNLQHILAEILSFLFLHENIATAHTCFSGLLQTLSKIDPEKIHDFSLLDLVLGKLLLNPLYVHPVQLVWTSWMINHGGDGVRERDAIELFPRVVSALVKQPDLLATIITNWLGADDSKLGAVAGGLISFLWVRNFRQPVFAKAVLDELDNESLIFLVRRLLGFVFDEAALLSLTFSLLNTDNAVDRTHDLVKDLLINEVGRDFLGAVPTQLAQRMPVATLDEQKMFDEVSEALTTYENKIENLPRLAELRSPQRLRRAIDLRRARDMAASQAAADEKSVLNKLFAKVSIKAGNGTFYVRDDKISAPNMFQSHSVEVSLPRRYYTDPVSYDFSRRLFRNAKRGQG